jgi:hypothetical protein
VKGFKLDSSGDIAINKGIIEMVEGNELLAQTTKAVLQTNKGEWFFNLNEGITFANILGKHNSKGSTSSDEAMKQYYHNEIAEIKEANNEDVEKLRRRLEGV